MATSRMVTRLQSKKDNTTVSRKECGSPTKRKTSISIHTVEDENSLVDQPPACLNKSYPQDHHDPSQRKVSKKAVVKTTDHTGKQRQTLSERGVNTFKSSVEGPKKSTERKVKDEARENSYNTHSHGDCSRNESPILLDSPREGEQQVNEQAVEQHSEGDNITQEEINQLEEQTTVEEMMYEVAEEALVAELPPSLTNGDYHDRCPDFNRGRFSFDTSMEIDPWREAYERRARPLPQGVVDIDKDSDTLHTSIYSNDIIEYLKIKEVQSPLPHNFLESSPAVTPKMRGVLMDWLIQVQAHEELEEETLHLCVALIDRYLASVRVTMPRLQLVGITCLLIATKFLERFAPEISTLCYLTAHSFKTSQVIRYEMQVLVTLAFDLAIPVSVTFVRRYLQVHEEQQPQEVTSLAYYILDLSITSTHMASVLPSVLAASAVYLARRLVLGTGQAWTASLAHYTSYANLTHLCDVVNELANLVYKAPTSKFQGARNKYNTEQHCFVSGSRITSPESVESHFLSEVSDA